MEKELRLIKNRGYFPVPQLAPKECKMETIQDKETLIKEIDEVAVEMLNAIRESEENYRKEQEQARVREEELRSTRQTSRSNINLYPTLANSNQSETLTQDQINPEYISTQTLFTMFTQLHRTEANSSSHQKMTQYYKEQLHHQRTSLRPMQLTQQVVMNCGDETTPQT